MFKTKSEEMESRESLTAANLRESLTREAERRAALPKGKTYEQAKAICHVRSAIYRLSNPTVKYWKNNRQSLDERVPRTDKAANDWAEYDPREDDSGSGYGLED